MAGIDRIPSGLTQSLLSNITNQVRQNPDIASALSSALSILRALRTDSFTPAANGNTGIVPPNLATGNGNTGIVPPGVATNGNTGIVPPGVATNGNTGIVPPNLATGNGNTGIVPPNLSQPPLPPPPLGTGSGNVGDVLGRLGQLLQVLGQLLQSISGGANNGGPAPTPVTSSPAFEKEFLAWASPFTQDAYKQLKANGIQLSEQEANKLGEMSPEQQKAYVAQRIGGAGGAQPATGNDLIQQMLQKFVGQLSPDQKGLLEKIFGKLGTGTPAPAQAAQGGTQAPAPTTQGTQAPATQAPQATTEAPKPAEQANSTQDANSAQQADRQMQLVQTVLKALVSLISLLGRMTEMNRARPVSA